MIREPLEIIEKLSSYSIDNIELDWFTDYLFQHHITVAYRDSLSDKQKLFSGVPQGSILGPLLFLIYFNDVVDIIKNSHIIKYADDTVLCYSGKNIHLSIASWGESIENNDSLKKKDLKNTFFLKKDLENAFFFSSNT